MVDKVLGLITDPKQMATDSSDKQIAEVVYEAYGWKSELRHLVAGDNAGDNAKRSLRVCHLGNDGFRNAIAANGKYL